MVIIVVEDQRDSCLVSLLECHLRTGSSEYSKKSEWILRFWQDFHTLNFLNLEIHLDVWTDHWTTTHLGNVRPLLHRSSWKNESHAKCVSYVKRNLYQNCGETVIECVWLWDWLTWNNFILLIYLHFNLNYWWFALEVRRYFFIEINWQP